ncbi:MAG: hypothetical protein Aurels2KO_06950 [Aureliella sp.]
MLPLHRRLIVAMIASACLLLSGCGRDETPARYAIGSVRTHAGITGRSVIELPAGLCVVLHFPPSSQPTDKPPGKIILKKDVAQYDEPLAVYGDRSTFNCASFALAGLLDLSADDWIEPLARSDTLYTVPAEIVLNSYCDLQEELIAGEVDWSTLATTQAIRDGDIFCYCQSAAGRTAFAHMGKIRKRENQNLLVSKFGMGPIVETTLRTCGEEFGFETLRIYRPR